MKYLTNAINFMIRNWLLILPVFILMAIVNLVVGTGSKISFESMKDLASANNLTDPGKILAAVVALAGAFVGAGILGFIIKFIYEPATYGLVNKGLETGNTGLNDLGAAIGANFVKYVIYFVGMLVVGLAAGVAATLLMVLLGLVLSLLKGLGIFLMIIVVLALILFFIVLFVLLSLWFAAMVVDGLDVVAAARRSVEVVKDCFWTILGITVLVGIACAAAGWILGLLSVIPLLGPIIASVVPAVQYFLMTVFYLIVYREKTGKTVLA